MDDSFDDDDDPLLMELVRQTQHPAKPPPPPQNQQQELFRADGEISILRAHLQLLQLLTADEIARLNKELDSARSSNDAQVTALRQLVEKLEDEKKFLGNEVRSLLATRKRKIDENPPAEPIRPAKQPPKPSRPVSAAKPVHVDDEWSQFSDHLWRYTINGSIRATLAFLEKIAFDQITPVTEFFVVEPQKPIMLALWLYLLQHKHLRLDELVHSFTELLIKFIFVCLDRQKLLFLPVPFLLSLVYATISFKTSAVDKNTVKLVVLLFLDMLDRFLHLLDWTFESDDPLFHQAAPYQRELLEKLSLVFLFDTIEYACVVATQYGDEFVQELWGETDFGVLHKLLPENTERFKLAAQINLVYNFVVMHSAAVTEAGLYGNAEATVRALIKVFLIDLAPKEDMMFYGLNRMLGNNRDLAKLAEIVPENPDLFGKPYATLAFPAQQQPIPEKEMPKMNLNHEYHLLSLRLRIVLLLEIGMLTSQTVFQVFCTQESIKSMVRIIGFEQNHVMHNPRAQHVFMRVRIIAGFIKMLFYVIDEIRNINSIIYPETLYEIFVVLMRVAFGADSLLFEAHSLLTKIRASGFTGEVFHRASELRAREVAHVTSDDPARVADAEADFANGLESPYDHETVETAREILSVCVNHDEADNLYANMHAA